MEENKLEKNVEYPPVFNREAFRKTFSEYYNKTSLDIEDVYTRLYSFYANLSEFVRIEPAPKHPNEFECPITDDDLLDLEVSVGIAFQGGINYVAKTFDASAGRPFIPRDPTGDGSYWTAYSNLIPDEQEAIVEEAKTTKPDPKASAEILRGIIMGLSENQ